MTPSGQLPTPARHQVVVNWTVSLSIVLDATAGKCRVNPSVSYAACTSVAYVHFYREAPVIDRTHGSTVASSSLWDFPEPVQLGVTGHLGTCSSADSNFTRGSLGRLSPYANGSCNDSRSYDDSIVPWLYGDGQIYAYSAIDRGGSASATFDLTSPSQFATLNSVTIMWRGAPAGGPQDIQ